jgi:uncharacterized protein HemY
VKYLCSYLSAIILLSACQKKDSTIVEQSFIDSLIQHYTLSKAELTNRDDLIFWQRRMVSIPENFSNGPKYASALASRFRLYGDIHDLLKADSLIKESNIANQEKEGDIFLSMAGFAIQQHQFNQAATFVDKAKKISDNKYGITLLQFDVAFETGLYQWALTTLKALGDDRSYGNFFRKAKYEHYSGSLDSSISYMLKAAERATNSPALKQAALSNAGDLCIHKGDLQQAYALYKKSIETDAADHHSLTGIGWIALVYDKNDSLAERIFSFIHQHTKSPDILLKMEQLAEFRMDSIAIKKYAEEFAKQSSNQPLYGNMYNKYLIALYAGVLNDPAKAVVIAEQELKNRSTPQTNAWYAWALLQNNQKEKAASIFKSSVSGKPLEGLELYYMGKLMQSMDKGYNAEQYFKAAYKNRYDLSPEQVRDLEKISE